MQLNNKNQDRHLNHPVRLRITHTQPHQYELRCKLCDKHIKWLNPEDYSRINTILVNEQRRNNDGQPYKEKIQETELSQLVERNESSPI